MSQENGRTWLHSHGLAEIGFFDFDVLDPSEDLLGIAGADAFRALAFAIVEKKVQPDTPSFELADGLAVRLVEVSDWNRRASAADRAARDPGDREHNANRSVVCEPPGFLARWFDRPKPSRALSRGVDDGMLILFSNEASDLMARRARATYPQLRRIHRELAGLSLPTLVKIGYVVDEGGPTDKEHLWFEVHELDETSIEATLVNAPFEIARMKEGDRGRHPVELLSDWTIITPGGPILPRGTKMLRFVRAHRAEIEAVIREERRA